MTGQDKLLNAMPKLIQDFVEKNNAVSGFWHKILVVEIKAQHGKPVSYHCDGYSFQDDKK